MPKTIIDPTVTLPDWHAKANAIAAAAAASVLCIMGAAAAISTESFAAATFATGSTAAIGLYGFVAARSM